MAKISWKSIINRVTGLSCPIFGISWDPPEDQLHLAEQALTFLENEGLLYNSFDYEHPKWCHADADKVREGMTALMMKLPNKSHVRDNLAAIRSSCREFMRRLESYGIDTVESNSSLDETATVRFHEALFSMRTQAGIQIANLAVEYGLDVESQLESILPPVVE